eukprot:362792-Ditylum_brightwellii.AAC.1
MHNKQVAEIHALLGDITAEKAPKAIINVEDMANMWRKISYADKGNTENQLITLSITELWPSMETTIMYKCKLEDPTKASIRRKLELPEEILHYLKVHNRRHFGQAH